MLSAAPARPWPRNRGHATRLFLQRHETFGRRDRGGGKTAATRSGGAGQNNRRAKFFQPLA